MLAHIIHSQNRPERLENIVKQSEEQGFEFRLWDAVIDENPIRGCSLAHKQIVKWAKLMGQSAVWILEDDCVFTDRGAADEFLKLIPDSYQVYTGGMYGTHKFHEGNVPHYMYPKTITGLHCYVVNSSYYDRFLALDENLHIDRAISEDCERLEIVLSDPLYALQMPGYSDMSKQQVDYNNDKYLWQYNLYKQPEYEEIDFEITEDCREYWRELGTKYGYPVCCIEEFITEFNFEHLGDPDKFTAGAGTGFIPCTSHAKQIVAGEITLESLITNRTATTLFPNSE